MNIGGGSSVNDSGERWVIKYFGKHQLNNMPVIIFDVGANVGCYAFEVISNLKENKNIKLYCFEPSKKTFSLLTRNLSTSKNIELFNFGFGDKEELVPLYTDAEGSVCASIYNRHLEHFDFNLKPAEEICLRTLDEFCKDKEIDHINFLKLDVEGHELKVLNGAQNLLSSNSIDFIQFEFGECNIDSRTYFQDFFYLLNKQYKINRILKDGLFPIKTYEAIDENFITTNYLAISRKL